MDEKRIAEKRVLKTILIIIGICAVILIGGLVYLFYQSRQQLSDMTEAFQIEKAALTDDYEELSLQYEGYKFSIGNDSLVALLTTEQMRVQRLMEELRTVKATNARRISELKRELETLRKVMRNFVIQIDSLNAENERLKRENVRVERRYHQASTAAAELTKEKEQLTERVTLASRLEATSIVVTPVTARGKPAKRIDKIAQIVITFQIGRNVTAAVGEKSVYIRLLKPDNDILRKGVARTFAFEGRELEYSITKVIEYGGEELSVTMYWDVEEYLLPGEYRVDIFIDGNLIGKKAFVLAK